MIAAGTVSVVSRFTTGLSLTFNAASLNETDYRRIFAQVFPYDSYSTHSEKVLNHRRWLASNILGNNVGISGLYALHAMPSSYWVDYFGVLPDFQGEGYGHIMMRHLIEEAAAHNADHLTLCTTDAELQNTGLERFYLKNGFERVSGDSKRFRDHPVHVFSRKINSPFPINMRALPIAEWLH